MTHNYVHQSFLQLRILCIYCNWYTFKEQEVGCFSRSAGLKQNRRTFFLYLGVLRRFDICGKGALGDTCGIKVSKNVRNFSYKKPLFRW